LVSLDIHAEAAFDGPKRLAFVLTIVVTAIAAAFGAGRQDPTRGKGTRVQRGIAFCAGAAMLLALASAFLSPHREVAVDGVRTMLLFAAFPILCALEPRAWRAVTTGYLLGAAVNLVVAVAQALGVQLFTYRTVGGWNQVSALVGNTGVLAMVIAFAALILAHRLGLQRPRTWLMLAATLALLVVGRSITAVLILICGVMVQFLSRRLLLSAAVLLFTFAATDALHRFDRLLSYRMGAWQAAMAMSLERPLLGYGPNTYGSEYASHVDPAWVNPELPGSYVEAHNDWVQAAAEIGIPATLLFLIAAGLLFWNARRDPLLLSVLTGGALAALTWFPLQRPETAILLLAAAGHAWRQE